METQTDYDTPSVPKSAVLAILQDRPIAYHPILAKALGGVKQAVFVSQLLYWTGKGKRADGFIWKTQEEWTDETGLSAYEQRTARKHLVKSGVLQEKLKSVPARLYYRLNTDVLQARVAEYHEQVMEDLHNKNDTTLTAIPESTPEITTQEEPPLADSPPDASLDDSAALRNQLDVLLKDSPDILVEALEDVAETEALFKPPKPSPRKPPEQEQARMRDKFGTSPLQVAAVVEKARGEAEHPDMTDASKDGDPWANGPLLAFCAVAHIDPEHIKPSERKDWPKQLHKWASTWEDAAPTPAEVVQCLKGITESEHAWKTFTSPRQYSLQETMDVMLSRLRGGQPWNAEGKRNGGPSTARKEPVIDLAVKETMSRLFDERGVRIGVNG
jgi:hypothetical protein